MVSVDIWQLYGGAIGTNTDAIIEDVNLKVKVQILSIKSLAIKMMDMEGRNDKAIVILLYCAHPTACLGCQSFLR